MDPMPAGAFQTDFDPLIVCSPTIRSGTTLLQRLLCSARNALIYGERCGEEVEFFLKVYTSKALLYHGNRRHFAAGLDQVLRGEVNDWILDLMPDIDDFLEELGRSCFAWLAHFRDSAARAGRPVWGFKYPGWPPPTLRLVRQLLPRSRFLYVHRDILDCLKSARARDSVRSVPEVQAF